MMRSLADVDNIKLEPEEAVDALALALLARAAGEQIAIAEAYRLNTTDDPRPRLAWQVQRRHVSDIARARGDESAANLCNELAFHLNLVGAYEEARPYYERSLPSGRRRWAGAPEDADCAREP